MATFTFDAGNLEAVEVGIGKLTALTPETRKSIIMAGADKLVEAMKKYLRERHHRTGDLERSISAKYYASSEVALVGPHSQTNKRKIADSKGRTYTRTLRESHSGSGGTNRKKHHGAAGSSTMEEVGYFLEYGTPRMKATHWMEISVNNAIDEFDEAVGTAWDSYLDSVGF